MGIFEELGVTAYINANEWYTSQGGSMPAAPVIQTTGCCTSKLHATNTLMQHPEGERNAQPGNASSLPGRLILRGCALHISSRPPYC